MLFVFCNVFGNNYFTLGSVTILQFGDGVLITPWRKTLSVFARVLM